MYARIRCDCNEMINIKGFAPNGSRMIVVVFFYNIYEMICIQMGIKICCRLVIGLPFTFVINIIICCFAEKPQGRCSTDVHNTSYILSGTHTQMPTRVDVLREVCKHVRRANSQRDTLAELRSVSTFRRQNSRKR